MRLYEAVIIIHPHSSDEQLKGYLAKINEIFAKYEARIVQKTEWGKRPLGFHKRKQTEGYYFLIDFESNTNKITEIQYAFRLSDFILFSTILAKKQPVILEAGKISA